MAKFFLRFFLIVFIAIISTIIFLTYLGLETDRFDNLIKSKTNEINQNLNTYYVNEILHSNHAGSVVTSMRRLKNVKHRLWESASLD